MLSEFPVGFLGCSAGLGCDFTSGFAAAGFAGEADWPLNSQGFSADCGLACGFTSGFACALTSALTADGLTSAGLESTALTSAFLAGAASGLDCCCAGFDSCGLAAGFTEAGAADDSFIAGAVLTTGLTAALLCC